MPSNIPTTTLNNGAHIPQVGFGVFQVPPEDTKTAVLHALEAGYRHIDTAKIYRNEEAVGQAIAESGIAREDLFVTTKLWNDDHGHDEALKAFDTSMDLLGLDYLDLYLIHWPAPANDKYVDSWTAFEELYADGRTKTIGVSNFTPDHLQRLIDLGGTVPAINQIELHPAFAQADARQFHAAHGIATEAWSPLAQGKVLGESAITQVAERLDKTPAQIVLAWHLALGNVVIPKSVTPERIVSNLDIVDISLTDDDVAAINALDSGGRIGADPADVS